MKDRVLFLLRELLLQGGKFEDCNLIDRPAMRAGNRRDLIPRFRQRYIESDLPAAHPLEQILQRNRGLAHSGVAQEQVKAVLRQSTAQDLIQTRDPGR